MWVIWQLNGDLYSYYGFVKLFPFTQIKGFILSLIILLTNFSTPIPVQKEGNKSVEKQNEIILLL